MFSLFSNKKEGIRSIILDIQSGLVRGALVEDRRDCDENGKIHIISVVTKSISSKTHIINAEHLTKRILKLIEEVVEHISRDNAGKPITKVSYILSSPWIFSKLKTVEIDYENETEITSKILSDIVKSEVKNHATEDIVTVEQKIFEVKLNGYPMASFQGKKAHKLDVSLSTSFSSAVFLHKIRNIVDKYIHTQTHNFNSALLMQYLALREILHSKDEFIYIHIHNEITDIIVVKKNLCKHIASFPFGISTLLRKIASGTKGTMEASDSILSLNQANKLDNEEKVRITKIVNPLITTWNNYCIQSFEGVFDITTMPRTIYLCAHSHLDLFKDTLTQNSDYNFNIIPYDSIDTGDQVVFEKNTAQSSMMKIYALASDNMI